MTNHTRAHSSQQVSISGAVTEKVIVNIATAATLRQRYSKLGAGWSRLVGAPGLLENGAVRRPRAEVWTGQGWRRRQWRRRRRKQRWGGDGWTAYGKVRHLAPRGTAPERHMVCRPTPTALQASAAGLTTAPKLGVGSYMESAMFRFVEERRKIAQSNEHPNTAHGEIIDTHMLGNDANISTFNTSAMVQWYTAVKRMAPGKTHNFISLAIEWVYLLDGVAGT